MGLIETIMVVLIILKLCGVIDLSWFWVLLPVWVGLVAVGTFFLFWFIGIVHKTLRND